MAGSSDLLLNAAPKDDEEDDAKWRRGRQRWMRAIREKEEEPRSSSWQLESYVMRR